MITEKGSFHKTISRLLQHVRNLLAFPHANVRLSGISRNGPFEKTPFSKDPCSSTPRCPLSLAP